jgi:hypothetical protein
MRTEGNVQARFSRLKSKGFNKLYRLTSSFFALRKYFKTHFWWQCVMPGVVWWVVWAESPIQSLKIRMVIYGIATSKNHIELLVPGQI